MKLFSALVGVVALLATGAAQTPQRPPVMEVARNIQRTYESVHDFSADFTQSYTGGALGQQVTERGSVLIKKPWKMRWTYTNPEKKLFVSDGVRIYSYIPQDKQVYVSPVPAGDETSIPTLFLAGKGNITRDFVASWTELPNLPRDSYAVKLVPTRKESEYEWLILVVDGRSLQLRMLTTVDRQGGRSTFSFTNIKENLSIPDKEFVFKIPRGVEVIYNGEQVK